MARFQIALVLALASALAPATGCTERRSASRVTDQAAPVPAGAPPAAGRMSLLERLGYEAQTRPPARPRPEAVAAALAAGGLPLERWKQVLASPIGARFCMAGQTAAGSVVAVCEFGNEAEAAAGQAYSHKTFDPLIPNRALVRRGQTLLTITRPSAAGFAEADHVAEIFAAL